jgi:hypothetical protein
MRDSNARKSAFLGMPHGTPSNRLRKIILLHLLQKHGENICFKCSGKIEDANDLSIEHKLPWEGISVELFWSLDNIAFSHLRCNTPHRYVAGGVSKRKVGPEGTAWCIGYQDFRAAEDFSGNRSRWNGLQNYCNLCLKKANSLP